MRHRPLLPAVTAIAVLAAVLVSTSPGEGSEARWRESVTSTATGPRSDVFPLAATDVPDPLIGASWPAGRLNNTPRVDLTNGARRHSSWVDVRSTRLSNAVATDTNPILSKIALEYTQSSTSCETATTSYWYARSVGTVTAGSTYPRSQARVDGATIGPGGTRLLCPLVRPSYPTSTTAGQRDFLRNHAGRAVDITTVVGQRSEAPATWSSPDATVTSRYRVAMPTPTTPSSRPVCQSDTKGYGSISWGWPDAATSTMTSTPAISDWVLLRRSATGSWVPALYDFANGDPRGLANIPGSLISNDGMSSTATRQLKLRGYPFAGRTDIYVESSWVISVYEDRSGDWRCSSTASNPDAGPHNLP